MALKLPTEESILNAEIPPALNGRARASADLAALSPTGPVMPRRTKVLLMPEEYGEAGMELTVWINYPNWMGDDIFGNNDEKVDAQFQDQLNAWLNGHEPGVEASRGDNRTMTGLRLRDQRGVATNDFRSSGAWDTARSELKEVYRQDALGKIVLAHNGWWNPDVEPPRPFPPANTRAFWKEISNELALSIFSVISNQIRQLPNSVSQSRT